VTAPPAWDRRTSCAKVAVLDSGAQYDHPDLKPNIWHNPHEKAGNGKDDDRNGYVDDYYGVNVVSGKLSGSDADGHGTHVAGIIAARGDNGTGVSGACWTGTLIPIRFMNERGRGSVSNAIAGIEYAIDAGAKIINCSFGSSSKSTALRDAVDEAQHAGVLLVVAAGNDGEDLDEHPMYPASLTNGNILTVAATDAGAALASFSSFGRSAVDLGAPGDRIYSTYLQSGYRYLSGTSMAAPLVTAAAAMLRSANSKLTYKQLRSIIRNTVTPNAALAGKTVSGGELDISRALADATS
jgi:subtilisin family serine protease